MCLESEREIGVEAHCQHSRGSHILSAKPPCSENVSGGERTPALPRPVFSLSLIHWICWVFVPHKGTFFLKRETRTLNRNNGVHRDLVKICD